MVCDRPSLVGRDIIRAFGILPAELLFLESGRSGDLDKILKKDPKLFQPGLGLIKAAEAHLHLSPGTTPKFLKEREVAYGLRQKVTEKIDRLVENGVLSLIPHSDWATPVVSVLKKNGSFRICGDFKHTVNKACSTKHYSLPLIEVLFASLSGGDCFSILDLWEAYNQISLDKESRKLTVRNTHKGLFQKPPGKQRSSSFTEPTKAHQP